jgi:dipeptidyl-peptidase-4
LKHLNIQSGRKLSSFLYVYDANSKATKEINLGKYDDFYIARIRTNDSNVLSAQVLNRHQDNLDLLFIDGTTGATSSSEQMKRL